MIADVTSRYQLNVTQFESLFEDKIEVGTLESLSQSTAGGKQDSIDLLHNLALRQDSVGEQAENILFDLFSGKSVGKKNIDSEIQKASLTLYQMARNGKAAENNDMGKLHTPSKLLYMAGSALSNAAQIHDTAQIFTGQQHAQSQFEEVDEVDLWSPMRLLTTDEISAATKNNVLGTDDLSLNFPVGLINPSTGENILATQIAEQVKRADFLAVPELFPVNTGGHWILFALYKNDASNKVNAAVFNSASELNPEIKHHLSVAAKTAGAAAEKDLVFIENNMQDNVPNGCGIFVVRAINALASAPSADPVSNLKMFVENFFHLSEEEQALFNIQSRRQIYAHSIA